eukprot:TRINITY_DN2439_c0_g1_i1.p1 TRINITY_DN2439_c0_g1~~TRINITY_DN2439_c0_g1_i1.p1  ORF type:complete len:527 (+),score=133.82 TRINITY_DN2439_c0_g1_i1:87-1667(+)
MSDLHGYVIKELLGQGTYGRIFRAVRTSDQLDCVVKEVPLDGLSKQDREDALYEAKLHSTLQHFNIIRYYDSLVTSSNTLYIVMEHAAGGDLAKRIASKKTGERFDEELLWNYLIQIAQGLKHIHEKRILHRDMKPGNIFLDENENIRIGDLGLGKALGPHSIFARTGVGTPLYFSPELCQDRPYDQKSDIWGFGCVMYELMTLQPPFVASNQLALASKIVNDDPEPVMGDTYSHELQFLVLKMLEKDVSKRPSIDQILSYSGVRLRVERAKLRHKEMRLQERYARLECHWKKTLKQKDSEIISLQEQVKKLLQEVKSKDDKIAQIEAHKKHEIKIIRITRDSSDGEIASPQVKAVSMSDRWTIHEDKDTRSDESEMPQKSIPQEFGSPPPHSRTRHGPPESHESHESHGSHGSALRVRPAQQQPQSAPPKSALMKRMSHHRAHKMQSRFKRHMEASPPENESKMSGVTSGGAALESGSGGFVCLDGAAEMEDDVEIDPEFQKSMSDLLKKLRKQKRDTRKGTPVR